MVITADDVTIVIPSLPDREESRARAYESVMRQTCKPHAVIVEVDEHRYGAHVTRNAALARVETGWVAFLDDDDEFHPDHLETLIAGANESGADLVGTYPLPDRPAVDSLGCCLDGVLQCPPVDVPWGAEQMDHFDARLGRFCRHCRKPRGSFIMFTNLVRMSLVRQIGGVPKPGSLGNHFAGWQAEDYLFLLRLLDAGARFHHVTGVRTWTYHVRAAHRPHHPVDIAREAILTHDALQKGAELTAFLALLEDVQPRTVVEIGSDKGGTLWAWRQLSSQPRVVAITKSDGPYGSARTVTVNEHGCEVIYGDSHDPATVDRLEELLDGSRVDMLFVDGDHTFKGVSSDFEMYRHLVRPGGLIAFHDICDHPNIPEVKVKAFWDLLEGDKEAIVVTEPWWGGIGVLRVPEMAEVAA